jgi:hypothetical protein
MSLRRLLTSCIMLSLAAWCGQPAAAVQSVDRVTPPALYWRLKLSVGYHYSRGDYGNPDPTDIHYVPLVLTADIDRWRLQATIPYLHISGPPGIIEGPDGPIQTTDGTSDGLGDLLARASYLLPLHRLLPATYAARPWVPYVDLIGLVKFPTASRSRGLGTGEFDFGIESELTWTVDKLTPFTGIGYGVLGSPPGTHLDNVVVASVGATYRILSSVTAGLLLDYRQAPTPATGERLELVPYGSWRFLPPWSVDAYVSAGLAPGSPDVGTGFQVAYTW